MGPLPVATHLRHLLLITGLLAATVSARASDSKNLAPNPGFELPENAEGSIPSAWQHFSTAPSNRIATTQVEKRSGNQCAIITAYERKDISQGIYVDLTVKAGQKYSFSAYVKSHRQNPLGGSAHGMLAIEWLSPEGKEISRSASPLWDHSLSRMRWNRFDIKSVRAPKGVLRARFGIHLVDGPAGGRGSVLIDDVAIEP